MPPLVPGIWIDFHYLQVVPCAPKFLEWHSKGPLLKVTFYLGSMLEHGLQVMIKEKNTWHKERGTLIATKLLGKCFVGVQGRGLH